MSSFVVSARKYRPSRFADVVGQEHVTLTLKNALQNDKLAHAFLFCGPRGVGKTTCARILAKVLNCRNVGADYEPCNECSSCRSFAQNASFNITELDAASNNSVEHIRALIEQVRFQPQQGKYKVFIIDEVHMLSQQAFNAFLKTLEEPPPYAVFILATTEKHKIIPTILSRCQIFDFRRIRVADTVEHLERICREEGIRADRDALHIIAQKSDGALRDALSIFDRVTSFAGNEVRYDDVINNLNVLDYDYFFRMIDALLTEDVGQVLLILDDVLRKGFDPDIFINGLAEHLRNLLVCRDPETLSLLEVSETLQARYLEQAELTAPTLLLTALNIANDCDVEYKMARNKRLHVEMALIKMTFISRAAAPGPIVVAAEPEKKNPSPEPPPAPPGGGESLRPPLQPVAKEQPPEPRKEAPAEAPLLQGGQGGAPTALKASEKYAMPRLKDLDAMVEEVKATERDLNHPPLEITPEALTKSWNQYLEEHCSQDAVRNTMRQTRLAVDGTRITATVRSPLAESNLRQESGLMEFLRQSFRTDSLVLTIEVKKAPAPQTTRKKPLNDREKLKAMNEQNPLVKELYERFDLRSEE